MIILMMGLPGSGKGSVAKRLENLGFSTLATGKYIRDEIFKHTELGNAIQSKVESAEYVDDEIACEIVKAHIDDGKDLIIEGFPRDKFQADMLDEMLEKSKRSIDLVLHFDFDEDKMYERLKGRQICSKCQAIYHETGFPSSDGKHCDECGSDLVHRVDDEPEKLDRKLKQYRTMIKPLINEYGERGIVKVIDARCSTLEMYYQVLESHKNFLQRNY